MHEWRRRPVNWNLSAEASSTTRPSVTQLQTPVGCFYLKESASTESVERILDLLEYLATAALPVPRYIATAAGQRYASYEGKALWLSREPLACRLWSGRSPGAC
jgi:hypothetical protein